MMSQRPTASTQAGPGAGVADIRARSKSPTTTALLADSVSHSAALTGPSLVVTEDPVLLAAYESILEIGLRRTTLADVARRAKVSRMTVYRRYDDLDRLLAALLTAELDPLLRLDGIAANRPGTMREQLALAISKTTLGLARHPLLNRVLSIDPEALLPLMVDRLGSTQRHALDGLTAKIAEIQSDYGDGSVRDLDPRTAALMIVTTTQAIVFAHRAISSELSDEALETEIATMVDGYLAPSVPEKPARKKQSAPVRDK